MNKIQQGFDIRSNSPVDSRFQFDTINEMNRYPKDRIPSGCITFCKEDRVHYKFTRTEESNLKTGSWVKMMPNVMVISRTDFEKLATKDKNTLYWVYEG